MNHTQVKLTWDETDPKRLRKFQTIMEQDPDEVDEEVYREFLASGSESEDAPEDENRDKIEEYRQKLLGALSENKTDDMHKSRDLQQDQKDEELDIKFNVGFGEDLGEMFINKKKEKKQLDSETAWDSYQRKRKEKRKEKKQQNKIQKEAIKSKGFGNPEEEVTLK